MGLAFFNSACKVGRQHVLDPYTEDSVRARRGRALRVRVGKPGERSRHFDPQASLTERGITKLLESRAMAHPDSLARGTLSVGGRELEVFRIGALQEPYDVQRLPYMLRVLLENVLRHEDGVTVTSDDVEARRALGRRRRAVAGDLVHARPRPPPGLHRVPAVVDLAAMRNAMATSAEIRVGSIRNCWSSS